MSVMIVKFWGTRGSIPTPGRKTEKYGGNTTCLEIRHDQTKIICDAGSGIRALSDSWTEEFQDQPVQASLVFTHLHWDHIQGFPFFSPAYQPQNHFDIFGETRKAGTIGESLSGQMQGDYFPIPIDAMKASLVFRTTQPTFSIDQVEVSTFSLPHPGGALGYRFVSEQSTLMLVTDCELDQIALNSEEVAADPRCARRYSPDLLKNFQGVHLLVIDCQYTDEDYAGRRGWGHNSLSTVVDLCAQVRPEMVALFHHDPQRTDHAVQRMVKDADDIMKQRGVDDVLVFAAREGLALRVETPRHPPIVDD